MTDQLFASNEDGTVVDNNNSCRERKLSNRGMIVNDSNHKVEAQTPKKDDPAEDPILRVVGIFGRWQLVIFILTALFKLSCPWHMLGISFLAPPTDYWCARPESLSHLSPSIWKRLSEPVEDQGGRWIYNPCMVRDLNYTALLEVDESPEPVTDAPLKECTAWEYDKSVFTNTITSQWNLVCSKKHVANLVQSIFMLGMLAGNLGFGYMADRSGRKKTLMTSLIMLIISGTACSFSPWLELFLFFKFFSAAATAAMFTNSFVLCMETVGGKWRTIIGIAHNYTMPLGIMILPGLSYLFRDWRYLQVSVSAPLALLIIPGWIIPESPRWLMAVGRTKEAEDIVRKGAATNGREIPDKLDLTTSKQRQQQNQNENCRRPNLFDLFRTPNLRKKTLVLFLSWAIVTMNYYGLSVTSSFLGGDPFTNMVFVGVVEIPAYTAAIAVLLRLGRRIPLCTSLVLGGVACLLSWVVPRGVFENDWPTIVLAMIGKLGISAGISILNMFTAELFPTVVRSVGVGAASMMGRFGGMVAPFVGSLSATNPTLPVTVFGATSVLAGFLTLLLPETHNRPLPETLEDGEEFDNIGKDKPKNKSKELVNMDMNVGVYNITFEE